MSGESSPVRPSECVADKRGSGAKDAAAESEPARERLKIFMVDKDRPTPLTLSDSLFDVDGLGGAKCAARGDVPVGLPDAEGSEGEFGG